MTTAGVLIGAWRNVLPQDELEVYARAGFGDLEPFGRRAALLVVDCTVAFVGSSPDQTLDEASREFPTACGPAGWRSLPHASRLIDEFRSRDLPIFYTRSDLAVGAVMGGATKAARRRRTRGMTPEGNVFAGALEPRDGELVIEKSRASAFFATPLSAALVQQGIDTVVVCGTTTSGCVRATAVDSFSYGFLTFLAEEACFDRSPTAHNANLWDLNAKYASVLTVAEVVAALAPQAMQQAAHR